MNQAIYNIKINDRPLILRNVPIEERKVMAVMISRLNKKYRSEKNPSTLVMSTKKGKTTLIRYAGVLEKIGGRYVPPRNPIFDL